MQADLKMQTSSSVVATGSMLFMKKSRIALPLVMGSNLLFCVYYIGGEKTGANSLQIIPVIPEILL